MTSPAVPSLDGCVTAAAARIEAVPDPGDGKLMIAVVGTGPRVVVLANESDETLCSWLAFTARLVASGYRVVLWDYGGASPVAELAGVTRRLRSSGAKRVVLMGASEGAKAALIAAAQTRPIVQGVVSLSAETTLQSVINVVTYVRHLRCPLLLVTAVQDPYGSAQAAGQFRRAARSQVKLLVPVPGSDHGTALLSGKSAATTLPAILAFLHRVLG